MKPVLAVLEITSKCNYACLHCYKMAKNNGKDPTFKNLKTAINKLSKAGCKRIQISGGEPFIRKDLPKIVDLVYKKNIACNITTNGFLLKEKTIDSIKDKCEDIQISLDGTRTVHEQIRGAGSFDKALEAIRILLEKEVPVSIMFTISKLNYLDFFNLLDFLEKNFPKIKTVGCERMVPVGHGQNLKDFILKPRELGEFYETIAKRKNKINVRIVDPLVILIDKKLQKRCLDYSVPCGGCLAGIYVCAITHKGELLPCVKINQSAGNIFNEKSRKLFKRLEELGVANRDLLVGKCAACQYVNGCGGCRAEALAIYSNIHREDPLCWQD